MLTRNYDSVTVAIMTILPSYGYTPTEADWLGGKPGVVKDHSGVIRALSDFPRTSNSVFGYTSSSDNFSKLTTSSTPALLIGSNNAEESYNDYGLDIIEELTAMGYRSASIAYTVDGCVYTTVKTFINNTGNDITVNELGIYQYYDNISNILLYRKKLDKSVTLKANGGTATFSLVIDIPYANKP